MYLNDIKSEKKVLDFFQLFLVSFNTFLAVLTKFFSKSK